VDKVKKVNVGDVQVGGGSGRVPPCMLHLCLCTTALGSSVAALVGVATSAFWWIYPLILDVPILAGWFMIMLMGRKKMRRKYGIPEDGSGTWPEDSGTFLCTYSDCLNCMQGLILGPAQGGILQEASGSLAKQIEVKLSTESVVK
jgi:hypothetical protein